jgi:tRNA(His) 5'-end guanylyltransferase
MRPSELSESQFNALVHGDIRAPQGPSTYLMARLHGRFSADIRDRFSELPFYAAVATDLMIELSPRLLHVYHDEIMMLWHFPDEKTQLPFQGSHGYLGSNVASTATYLTAEHGDPQVFEAQVWNTNSVDDVVDFFEKAEGWAFNHFLAMQSIKYGRHIREKADKVLDWLEREKGVSLDDFTDAQQHGLYLYKHAMTMPMSELELAQMPEHVAARQRGKLFERSVIVTPFEGIRRKQDEGSKQMLRDMLTGKPITFGTSRIVSQGAKKKLV